MDEGRLNDYADDLLDGDAAAAVEAHLRSCDRCAARVRSIRRLSADLAALPRSIEPGRDLRPDLRPAVRPWLRAAAVAGVLAAGTAVWALAGPGAGAGGGRAGDGSERGPATEMAAVRGPASAAADVVPIAPYDQATRALVDALDRSRPDVGPAVMGLVDRNLAAVDGAIRELERARARHPDDPELARLLADRYATRLALLRDALAMLTEA